MELLEVVDENNQLTGEVLEKEYIHEERLWYRQVSVIIENEKQEFLIQKRSANKKRQPNKWALTAGHVGIKEEPVHAVMREIQEEIGIAVKKQELNLLTIQKLITTTGCAFGYLYYLKTDKKLEEYTIQKEEVSEVRYASKEKIQELIKDETKVTSATIQYFKQYFDKKYNNFRR